MWIRIRSSFSGPNVWRNALCFLFATSVSFLWVIHLFRLRWLLLWPTWVERRRKGNSKKDNHSVLRVYPDVRVCVLWSLRRIALESRCNCIVEERDEREKEGRERKELVSQLPSLASRLCCLVRVFCFALLCIFVASSTLLLHTHEMAVLQAKRKRELWACEGSVYTEEKRVIDQFKWTQSGWSHTFK